MQAPPTVTLNGLGVTGTRHPAGAAFPRPVDTFYGIPFASARRFRAPERVDPGTMMEYTHERAGGELVFDASRPGSVQPAAGASWSVSQSVSGYDEAENPLRLNVFRPATLDSGPDPQTSGGEKGWPVVMYVHGGAFNFGNAMERDLVSFVSWARGPIVAVSAAYRLGALGFPLLDDDADDDDDDDDEHEDGDGDGDDEKGDRLMNLGLRDQRAAMEWVRDWIGSFGGDPAAVTMMGCSAGAHSIGHHMLSPSPPPFHKAILESGAPTARAVLSPSHPRTVSQWHELRRRLASPNFISSSSPNFISSSSSPPSSTSPARAPTAALVAASGDVFAAHIPAATWPFQPVVDGPGGLIPSIPLNLWSSLLSSSSSSAPPSPPPPIITGFCSHEGTTMVPHDADFLSFFRTLIPALSPADLGLLDALYPDPLTHADSPYHSSRTPASPPNAPFRRISTAYAHFAYIAPVLHTAHASSLRSPTRPVYLYEYAATSAPHGTASHGVQAPAVAHSMAGLEAVGAGPGLRAVADAMHARWTAFITAPDGRLPPWDAGAPETENLHRRIGCSSGTGGSAGGAGGGRNGYGAADTRWPIFKSPFDASGRDISPDADGIGELLVFGDGNDEAMGGKNPGTPVKVRRLTALEVRQCRFWWDRMELSQGMGEAGVARVFTG